MTVGILSIRISGKSEADMAWASLGLAESMTSIFLRIGILTSFKKFPFFVAVQGLGSGI